MTQPTSTEPCTNAGQTRRHYSTNLVPRPHSRPGREGTSLCRVGGINTRVYDEQAINAMLAQWRKDKPPIVIADLPECKACVRALTKLEATRG